LAGPLRQGTFCVTVCCPFSLPVQLGGGHDGCFLFLCVSTPAFCDDVWTPGEGATPLTFGWPGNSHFSPTPTSFLRLGEVPSDSTWFLPTSKTRRTDAALRIFFVFRAPSRLLTRPFRPSSFPGLSSSTLKKRRYTVFDQARSLDRSIWGRRSFDYPCFAAAIFSECYRCFWRLRPGDLFPRFRVFSCK